MEKNQIPGFEPGSIRSANRFDLERYLEPKWLRYLLLHFHRLASLYLVTQKKNTKSNTIAKRLVKVLRKIPKATRLQNPQPNFKQPKKGRTNRRNYRKNLSRSQHKDYSQAYNTWMQLSRLQRIYHLRNLTYDCWRILQRKYQRLKSDQVYFFSRNRADNEKRCLVSMDSDLEAFSRNPTRGSFAALASQPTAFTNYANLVFLSY